MKKQKVPTRIRLINSAVTLFQKHGYYGTSTQDIIDAAKAPRGSLYHHFPGGKAELASACIDTITLELIERIQTLRLQGLSPQQVVEDIAKGIADWLEKKKWEEGLLLPVLTYEFAGKDEHMHKLLSSAYQKILQEIAQMLTVANISNPAETAQIILSQLEGASGLARTLKTPAPLTETRLWKTIL